MEKQVSNEQENNVSTEPEVQTVAEQVNQVSAEPEVQAAAEQVNQEPIEPEVQTAAEPEKPKEKKPKMSKEQGKNTKGFQIVTNTVPIMISAPHSAKQLRNGKVQAKEAQTDYFATMIANRENVSCIFKTAFLNDDANADKESEYKVELKNFVQKNGIKYLLDLHTMSDKRLPDICIAINGGKNIQNRYTELQDIISAFNSNGISTVTVDEPFKAADPNCISNYISTTCNIPCFHIEINKKFSSITNLFSKSPFNKQSVEDSLCRAVQLLKTRI